MHIEQAEQMWASMTGSGHSLRGIRTAGWPFSSSTASWVQTRPQTPQLTQRRSLIWCASLRSPLMALTGHNILQAPHPLQLSLMEYAIHFPPDIGMETV